MDKVLVSACLGGLRCRYDGKHSKTELPVDKDIILFCPEQSGGLPTPREPAEIVGGTGADVIAGRARVISCSGKDVTHEYMIGAREALHTCQKQGINHAILKQRSPSCGVTAIYDGTFGGRLIPGEGVTAALLKRHSITVEER